MITIVKNNPPTGNSTPDFTSIGWGSFKYIDYNKQFAINENIEQPIDIIIANTGYQGLGKYLSRCFQNSKCPIIYIIRFNFIMFKYRICKNKSYKRQY